ncbi:probable calcium-transporting ATPase 8, plasma membrane-type [Zea mays]|uniref:Calcium-transporting ATPase n=2 Tax=Zea mays TaxID=4577 RepID=A0A804NYU3_MAIZE|nr:probable calcium-transporting ATPase 8, plasma membrane-type [Zea mays]|eukprot:XP_008679395.1 probable calcium-transporting ATPase 8, plasma membrane-type [Zea mays]
MERLESYLKEHFDVPPKNPSEEAQRRWRSAVGALVKNRRRRFRMVPDLHRRSLDEAQRRSTQEKIRLALYVQKAAMTFIDGAKHKDYRITEDIRNAGFSINPDELASITSKHDAKALKMHGGVDGVSKKIRSALDHGISASDLDTRQSIYGVNRYAEKPSRTFWMFVWDALQDMTLIILMVCALLSAAVGLASEGWPRGMYDGLGIMLSILLVVMVTAVSDYRQSLQFKELDNEKKKIFIHVTRDGSRQKVSIYDLAVGDIVHLSIGDQVPADGLYVHGYSLLIDESSLSGESEPVYVSQDKPFILAGTKVQDGSAKMMVTAVGMRTEWGRLMSTLSEGGEDETPLQVKLNGVATIIGKIGLLFATLTFVVLMVRFLIEKGLTVGLSKWYSTDALTIVNYFATAVTIIVVAVPEGLPLAVTLSLAFAMKKLMNDKALVRHLSACETMGSAGTICTDKTGTLTTNHMVVDKIWASEVSKSVTDSSSLEDLASAVSPATLSLLLQGIFENTSAEVVNEKDGKQTVLGTPTERAIFEFGLKLEGLGAEDRTCTKVKVEPFNSVKKKMAVLVSLHDGGSYRWFTKGASEIVVEMCDMMIDGDGNSVPLSEAQRKIVLDTINSFASDALRTLCLAYKDVDGLEDDDDDADSPTSGFTLICIFGIKDPLRPGVKDAVEACKSAGIVVRMVTGDNINTAKAIAKECGILTDGDLAIEGPEFRSKSPEEMRDIIPKIRVMARSLPLDKHTLVTNLRGMFREVVAVTGDGTNDAPALHEADIGLAMGIAGTEVAKESADVIVLDDNFTTIINVARWGRAVYINIQKFVQFQLTVNIVALVINFVSACITGSAPLTAVQLLWVNMIMDTLGALALATEPPNDDMMKRPPVGRGESFITKVMWRNIIGQSLYQLVVLGALMFGGEQFLNIKGADSKSVVNTLIFNSFVFCQVFNEINSREMEKINVFRGMVTNWIFIAIIAATVLFQVVIVELLGTFASTVPLDWRLWLLSVGLGSVSLVVGAVLKCIPVAKSNGAPASPNGYAPLPSGPDDI